MSLKPILEIKQTNEDDIKYCWGVYRSDRSAPIIADISRKHAEHIKIRLSTLEELPENVPPIKDWFLHDEIVEVDKNGFGIKQ